MAQASAGAVCLHNYPAALRKLERIDGQVTDLATLDLVRDRERGVPRYNDFREMLHMPRRKSIDEITPNKQWAKEINEIYGGDVDLVDTQIGMQAEQPPKGFGFSDTAFRIFILMASRRLKSDRFFTDDFRPEVYTQVGFDWVNGTSMKDVIMRHYPELEPALRVSTGSSRRGRSWARRSRAGRTVSSSWPIPFAPTCPGAESTVTNDFRTHRHWKASGSPPGSAYPTSSRDCSASGSCRPRWRPPWCRLSGLSAGRRSGQDLRPGSVLCTDRQGRGASGSSPR